MSGLLVSSSISSRTLSFIDRFTLSCIIGLQVSKFFLFLFCKRGVCFLLLMCLMLLLLEKGPRLSHYLIVCVCMLRRFHWLRRNLVDLGFGSVSRPACWCSS